MTVISAYVGLRYWNRTIRSRDILGHGSCHVHGDENNACLTKIEVGLCNPAYI